MPKIRAPLVVFDPSLPEVAVRVDRPTLHLHAWRTCAEDGAEFEFELGAALRHGNVIFQSSSARYVIRQEAEALLEISLNLSPSAAAGIGWAIGNQHLDLSAEPHRLLTPATTATRSLLDRLHVPYSSTQGVFRPGRFARGATAIVESGASHQHPEQRAPRE